MLFRSNDSTLKANNAELTLRPLRVIFTGHPQYALLPMLKVRYDDDGTPYTNDIEYNELSYRNENDYEELRNKADYYNMHNNIVAGFEAILPPPFVGHPGHVGPFDAFQRHDADS